MMNENISQLKKGYKQTEVGVIPEDWEVFFFNDITINIASGKSDTKSKQGKYPIYGSTGIIGYSSKFDYTGKKILVARVGANAGKVNKVMGEYCVSDNTLMIELKNHIYFDFINHFLIHKKLNKIVFGSGQPLITGGQLKLIKIPLPPTLTEQTAIATALSDMDSLIEGLEKLIAKKRNIKKGAMQELLTPYVMVNGELLMVNGKPKMKEGWKEKTLGEICDKIQDGNYGEAYPKPEEFLTTGIPFLTSKAIGKDGTLKIDLVDFISTNKHQILAKAHIELNDILFTNRGASVGAIGYVDKRIAGGNIGPQLTLIRTNDIFVSPKYLFQFLKTGIFRKQIIGKDSGSAMNFFGIGQTEKFVIPIPCKEEQICIAQILSDMDSEIEKLENQLSKYKQLKTGMMQELLTGKKRLV